MKLYVHYVDVAFCSFNSLTGEVGKAGMGKEQQVAGRYLPNWLSVQGGGGGGRRMAWSRGRDQHRCFFILLLTNSFTTLDICAVKQSDKEHFGKKNI
jgi:hypothetical protein